MFHDVLHLKVFISFGEFSYPYINYFKILGWNLGEVHNKVRALRFDTILYRVYFILISLCKTKSSLVKSHGEKFLLVYALLVELDAVFSAYI